VFRRDGEITSPCGLGERGCAKPKPVASFVIKNCTAKLLTAIKVENYFSNKIGRCFVPY